MTVYSSPYSSIEVDHDQHLLSATWFKKSIELNEEEVKKEISKILENTTSYGIKKIVVDVRDYPFRENDNIQRWINYHYIPEISEMGVQRYAIIVEQMVISRFENLEEFFDDEEVMKVKYFTNPGAAQLWLGLH